MAFEPIPVVSPVGSEGNCYPNGNNNDCQRPAAGQTARTIVQIDSDDSDKDTKNEMVNISELPTSAPAEAEQLDGQEMCDMQSAM